MHSGTYVCMYDIIGARIKFATQVFGTPLVKIKELFFT